MTWRRDAAQQVAAALADTPVVLVVGARQVGKSTLVTELLDLPAPVEVVTLDDPTVLAAADRDPAGLLEGRREPFVIDEVQRSPGLLVAIKAEVDRDRRPGRFLLTGSAELATVRGVSESLAGRVDVVSLWPLSQNELESRPPMFLTALFEHLGSLRAPGDESRAGYFERACAGGFPEALGRDGERRSRWFANYASTVVQRAVGEVASIQRGRDLPHLLQLCAARTGTELNLTRFADDAGIPARTLDTYLHHLRTIFLVDRIPAWSTNLTSKVIHRPKLVMIDSGLAAHLQGVDPDAMALPSSPAGQLIETFVAMELRKQIDAGATRLELGHFRERGGSEVDLVLSTPAGVVAGIEVKAASTVTNKDFDGLRLLDRKLGERFRSGVVLYTGREAVPFGDKLLALPISTLWTAGS